MTGDTVKKYLSSGWEKFKNNIAILIVLELIMNTLGQGPDFLVRMKILKLPFPMLGLVVLASWVLVIEMSAAWTKILLLVTDGKKPEIGDLFNRWNKFFIYFFAAVIGQIFGMLVLAAPVILISPLLIIFHTVVTGLAAGLLMILAILIGIILCLIVSVRIQFWRFLIFDLNCGPLTAVRTSWRMTSGKTKFLILLAIGLGVVNFIGFICLFVGLVFTYPITELAIAGFYRTLPILEEPKLQS